MNRETGYQTCSNVFPGLKLTHVMDLVRVHGYGLTDLARLKALSRAQGQSLMEKIRAKVAGKRSADQVGAVPCGLCIQNWRSSPKPKVLWDPVDWQRKLRRLMTVVDDDRYVCCVTITAHVLQSSQHSAATFALLSLVAAARAVSGRASLTVVVAAKPNVDCACIALHLALMCETAQTGDQDTGDRCRQSHRSNSFLRQTGGFSTCVRHLDVANRRQQNLLRYYGTFQRALLMTLYRQRILNNYLLYPGTYGSCQKKRAF